MNHREYLFTENFNFMFRDGLEVDDAIELLVTAAAATRRDATIDVAPAGLRLRLGQGALGALLAQARGAVAA